MPSLVEPSLLLKNVLNAEMDPEIVPYGAVIGGADSTQQQGGVVELMDAGDAQLELYSPLVWKRVQIRCVSGSDETTSGLRKVSGMGAHVDSLLHDRKPATVEDGRGQSWLVHMIYVAVGPSHHIDSAQTFEALLFAVVCVGRDPVPA